MFGLVKKLFGKEPAKPAAPQALSTLYPTLPPKPAPKPAAAPSAPGPAVVATATPAAPAPAPAAKTAAPAPEVPAAASRKPTPVFPEVFSKETVDLPFKQLWPKLNPEVVQSLGAQPKGDLRLPLNLVQAHLATGGMKIPFSQFRQFCAEGLFNSQTIGDATEIVIPLGQVLPRLKPEQLARRAGQKRLVVPDDIEAIFGPKGTAKGNLRIASEKKTPAPAAAADPAPAPTAIPAPAAALPAPVAPAAPITPVTPLAPEPVAVVPAPVVQAEPAPEPISNIPLRAPNLDPSLATLKPTAPVPSRAVPSKTAPQATFTIALMDVAGFWAEKGRVELEDLYRHSLEIPIAALEAALKRGKVEFPWREVRPWVRLASGNSLPPIDDETKVELPLSWIAPRFLEHQHKEDTRKRIEIGEDIPDVFVRNTPATPATVPFPAPAPVPAAEESKEPREFSEIFGQPDKREWSLGEVSQRATTLPGVAGAIIATSDGLLVGGTWPGADSNAVAAFAPQMYSRMASYTKELQLGEPNRFTLLIDNNVPLQIFKSADSYFTVLGRAGETLPAKELNAIATRLAASLTVK